jgi:hypothetical protein
MNQLPALHRPCSKPAHLKMPFAASPTSLNAFLTKLPADLPALEAYIDRWETGEGVETNPCNNVSTNRKLRLR